MIDTGRRRRQDDMLRSPRDIIATMNNELPPPFPPMSAMTIYTAAVWNNAADVPHVFVVGNGSVTMGPDGTIYINGRLNEGTTYGVFVYIRLESDILVSLTFSIVSYLHKITSCFIGKYSLPAILYSTQVHTLFCTI